MAKRQKVKVFSFQGFDNAHYKTTEAYTRAVNALFDKATSDIADVASRVSYIPDKPFSFDDYPKAKTKLQTTLKGLAKKMQAVIELGSRKQWLFACQKNDEFIASIFDTTKLTKGQLKKMQDRNLDALQSFQQRKVGGMNLSERVWKYTQQYKDQIEIGLDVGLGEGRSSQQLSRDLRQNLRDPNRLFRRVRDKRGNLQLSKVAKAFHPGTGVYRSSYKNAMRLTRSEINMAYRESDHLRWQQMDFVVGFEIRRANKAEKDLCYCTLCDRLVGKYPKVFKFKGWHPQCMCYCIPILENFHSKERSNDRVARLKAALNGTEHKKYTSKELITDYPEGFKSWVEENVPRQAGWKSTPYFIKDNFVDGDLAKGLIYIPNEKPLTLLERAEIRHQQRTPEQIQAIHARWDERNAELLKQKAQAVKDEVQEFALKVANRFGANVTPINLKTKASIVRKLATYDVNHNTNKIKDAVRTTIIVEAQQIEAVRQYFRDVKTRGGLVQRVKVQEGDRLLGYTGTIVNIKCSNGLMGEIQINSYKMIYAKEKPEDAKHIIGAEMWEEIRRETGLEGGLGHQYYEQYRVLTNEQQESEIGLEIKRKSEDYYKHFRE